jgi:phosphoglycerol transferase MdoB-like AlkP superfamily enzyme
MCATEGPFFIDIVAASSHTGFNLPGLEDKYSKVSIDVGEYKDTYFGNYLEAVNYSDYALGIFLDELKANGLYDDSVIFVYGDHYGLQMYNEEMLDFIKKSDHEYSDFEAEINYINVSCGMRIPGESESTISKVVSKLDIKPTLCYVCGIEDGFSLGSCIFSSEDFACVNNGIIITDDYYYNGDWYDKKDGKQIDLEENTETSAVLKKYIEYMEKELEISKSIILNNLLK